MSDFEYPGERRAHRRFPIVLPAMLSSENLTLSGITVNLSLGGVLVAFTTANTIGANVRWTSVEIGELGQFPCAVAHQSWDRIGMRFLRPARPGGRLAELVAAQERLADQVRADRSN